VPERDFSRSVPQRNTAIAQRRTAEMVPLLYVRLRKSTRKVARQTMQIRKTPLPMVHVPTQGLARHGPMSIQELVRARQRQLRRTEAPGRGTRSPEDNRNDRSIAFSLPIRAAQDVAFPGNDPGGDCFGYHQCAGHTEYYQ
jgi:hypothetical protein